jgi:sterol desaturase/sphingolipid hydroxylase (fatty acid hydroxylase superfamily)
MSLILYAIPFFLGCIALEYVISKRNAQQVYRFHDAVTSLNIGFISETIRSVLKLMSIFVYALVVDQVAAFEWDLKNPAVWVVAFFMYDFFYYWAHRSGHEVNLLWASHVVHHSSEEFNLSTALRQSWTNQIFYWIFYLPMAIVGIPVKVFVIIALVSALYQFWSHTRLVGKLGWADRIFVTPSNHRCHHGRNDYCIDKNYGGTLIIWDRIFGTYTEERDDEPVVYGTLTPLNSWNPVWGNFKNYTTLWRDMRDAKGWREKLYIVFAPPGLINTNTNSSVQTPEPITQRFATPVTRWQQIYGWLASGVVLALVIELLRVAPDLSWPARVVFTVTIILNTAGLSRIFEGRAGAVKLEASRCLLMFGCLGAGMWFYPLPDIARFLAVGILMVSLVLLFLLQRDQSSTITQNFMETA